MKFLYIFLLAGCLYSCSNKNNLDDTYENKYEASSVKVKYTVASNYFVNKNADLKGLKKSYIDSENDFTKIFGTARTMQDKSEPTKIDFRKQIVVPIILEETNIGTDITVESVYKSGNHLHIRYTVTEVQPISYVIQPSELIIINRKEISNLDELQLSFEKTTKVL